VRDSLIHPALIYSSDDEFLAVTVPFLREGLTDGEQALAVTSRRNIAALDDALGDDADRVDFHEAGNWLVTPWRALLAYRRYVEQHSDGSRVRIIGEPFAPERSPAAVREWTRYESILNIAFAGLPLTILCPYDAGSLSSQIVEHAYHTHPDILDRAGMAPSERYADTRAFSEELDRLELESPVEPVSMLDLTGDLDGVRRFVAGEASAAGVDPARVPELAFATHEVAANARGHGGGQGVVRTWRADGEFVCDVVDHGGGLPDSLVGHTEPDLDQTRGRGLWLARQLCDLVEVRSGESGTVVRLHVALG